MDLIDMYLKWHFLAQLETKKTKKKPNADVIKTISSPLLLDFCLKVKFPPFLPQKSH